ncbi:hypothetical protein J2S78_002724 [Salibacterium salarium]|uniref:alpha-L-rhamnosidase-related protein n=1 Tax=Salibacterium salarium TaxID=284579 RepID=UPI00278AB72B|nr:sugar hydrolase [Salibacterium salarium]MDQ0300277.1 hypothetical protein [Salibacterium salarium]
MENQTFFQQHNGQQVNREKQLLDKAEDARPSLHHKEIQPVSTVKLVRDDYYIHGWKAEFSETYERAIGKTYPRGSVFTLDFGEHTVGYLKLQLSPVGSPPDAPLCLKFKFGEMPVEIGESFSEYNGWLSSSWLQEETIYVDTLPQEYQLPRRYAFRYVQVEVVESSPKYDVCFDFISCTAVSSAEKDRYPVYLTDDKLKNMDNLSVKTLADCMQDVFEDGPKRDRRLWLGDLRLQALTNYWTFQQNDLVKRCLYLFAGVPNKEGRVAANVFTEPAVIPDDTYLFDYALFFVTSLVDYYEATSDIETLQELWPVARRQIELSEKQIDENGILKDQEGWWSFIDWKEGLNKQAASHAIFIYSVKKAISLTELLHNGETEWLHRLLHRLEQAVSFFWDAEQLFFVSGKERQVSWATQIWMVLAGVLKPDDSRELLKRLRKCQPAYSLSTPYMYHHFVEALLCSDMKQEAVEVLMEYWGGMMDEGADTFWELYKPQDASFSPYGSHIINSYCHAWSCTPAYFIRKYQL